MSTITELNSIDHMLSKAAEAETASLDKGRTDVDRSRAKRVANLTFRRAMRLSGHESAANDNILP